MAIKEEVCVCFFVSAVTVALSLMDVKEVEVERFNGDLPPCVPHQVCADVFDFVRTLDDGSRQRESRRILNCRCDQSYPRCGNSTRQLRFRETRTQSMITCEDSNNFEFCPARAPAKEEHDGDLGYFLDNYVYHVINCVCPNNDNPQDFYRRMTKPLRRNRYVRYFQCRDV